MTIWIPILRPRIIPASMPESTPETIESIGYLVSYEDELLGFVGGLLVVNQNARPLEFHCSIPFRPSSAQRVLYGETLEPYLLVDQIPSVLMGKTQAKLDSLIVEGTVLLELRHRVKIPIGSLLTRTSVDSNPGNESPDERVTGNTSADSTGDSGYTIHPKFQQDQLVISRALSLLARHVEIDEPMERLRVAIEETCKPHSNAA